MGNDLDSALADLVKALEQNAKAYGAAPKLPKDVGALPDPVKKAAKLTTAKAKEAAEAYAAMAKELDLIEAEIAAAMAKALAACRAAADRATKAYMAAVKDTDGLTSVKPSIVKVLQATGKEPDPKAIAKAVTELRAHQAEFEKAHGKDKAKMVASFAKGLETAAKELDAII